MKRAIGIALALALTLAAAPAGAGTAGPQVLTSDVSRFYAVYDAAGGHPSVEQLDAYLAGGSVGLHEFARLRRVTGARIAETLASHPETYAKARQCLAVLPTVKRRLDRALVRLKALYPEARMAPVTIVVGRGRPVGITSPSGVTMGLEALCAADFMNPNLEDRFVYTVAHEYGHVQQPAALGDLEPGQPQATVLRMSTRVIPTAFIHCSRSGAAIGDMSRIGTEGCDARILSTNPAS